MDVYSQESFQDTNCYKYCSLNKMDIYQNIFCLELKKQVYENSFYLIILNHYR